MTDENQKKPLEEDIEPEEIQENELNQETGGHSGSWIAQKEWIIAGSIFLILAILIWSNFPIVDQIIRGRYTSTPRPPLPTPTRRPTRTPTLIPSPTLTPMPSKTPLLPSAFIVPDTTNLEPALPALVQPPIILDLDSITADPEFSNPQWYPSSNLNLPAAANIDHPFYATFGPGSAKWMMDVPLAPGYYEIYILDTYFSSAGSLNFRVMLANKEIKPLLGETQIRYRSSQGENPQGDDLWRSLGLYYLEEPGQLSINTTWDKRDEFSIVAIGRVLIEPMPDSSLQMLEKLPPYPLRYIVDDLSTKIEGADTVITDKETLSWHGQFQAVVNPQEDLKVTWKSDMIPGGQYEIAVWVPASHNQTKAFFNVLVNGTALKGGPLLMKQSDWTGGQWVSLGTWDSTAYGKYVEMGVEMVVAGGTPGDVAIDAVAFMSRTGQ